MNPNVMEPSTLSWVDYGVIFAYLGLNLMIGWWFARQKRNSGQFFLGNKVAWWAIGISYYATAASSISFMALPAKTYADDWLVVGSVPAQVLATLVVAYGLVGVLARLNVTTIYEYLDRRFGQAVRMIGAILGVLMIVLSRMSVVLLLPALALSAVTGISVYLCIVVMGVVTVIYATEGGFEAVIWTDVLQAFVMFLGVGVTLFYLAQGVPGGLSGIWEQGSTAEKLRMASWSPEVTEATVWVFFAFGLGYIFSQLADQTLMQRIFAAGGPKNARRTLVIGILMGIPTSLGFFFVGTSLWAFYTNNPERLAAGLPNDSIFPYFIVNELPIGLVGLIIASLFAASMSTLSSAVNSTSAIIVRDFYVVLKPESDEGSRLRLAKWATVVSGLLATVMAAYLASLEVTSLWETFLGLVALVGGGFPGVIALGLLTKHANSAGAIAGTIASIVVTLAVQTLTTASVFTHGFIAIFSCILVGYVVSLLWPSSRQPALDGLTIFTMPDKAPCPLSSTPTTAVPTRS